MSAALLAIWVFLTVSCDSGDSDQNNVIPAPVKNVLLNQVTRREALVRKFQTTDVFPLPYSDHEFIVRDTNQAVWYVCWSENRDFKLNNGHTMLFKGSAPIAAISPRFDINDPENVFNLSMAAFRAMQAASEATASHTNRPIVRNFEQWKNNQPIVEDPYKPK